MALLNNLNKIKNILIPTIKITWITIRPKLINLALQLVKETYEYFKKTAPDEIEKIYKQLEEFEQHLKEIPKE